MKGGEDDVSMIDRNRQAFLQTIESSPEEAVRVQLDYDSHDFCRYSVVDASAKGEGMTRNGRIADGLVTTCRRLALFLPLGDCIGAILYDSQHNALMLTHLGRHNLEQNGGANSVAYMVARYGTDPSNIEVVLSPAAGSGNYPLYAFMGKGLADVATKQLMAAGVLASHIIWSSVDTTTDRRYFSHSEYLKGRRQTDGRFAIVAMLRA